jgi:hypothetical protein
MTTKESAGAQAAHGDRPVAVRAPAPDTERTRPVTPADLHAEGLRHRLDLSARSLRTALRYFSTTIQAQDELIATRRREMGALAGELASRQAELVQRSAETDTLRQELAHRDEETAQLAHALAQRDAEVARLAHALALARPSRLRQAVRHPMRAARYVLRRVRQTLRPACAVHAIHAPPEAPPEARVSVVSASAPPALPPVHANLADYRERMRALLAGGLFAGLRTVAILTPPTMREAGMAIERCLAETRLRCTVGLTMPDQFADDLYLVVSPGAFPKLPPADRRILWLVEPAGTAPALAEDVLAQLAGSLAIFDASLAHIQALQSRGIALHQTFYVPLDPSGPADAALADDSPMGLRHLLPRALHGCGALDDEAFEHATRGTRLDTEHVVLCLPESLARFENARNGLRHGAVPFPGIRHLDGWKGTALSYRYLARRALDAGRARLIVSEDDAAFAEGFEVRLAKTLAYLDAHAGTWDLFSGLLTDLSEQAEVKSIDFDEGDMFLRLDSVIGMVFGIYGHRALEALAAYRFAGDDVMRHTIDRYLESLKPRCLTLFPPLVRHDDGFSSTLWTPQGQGFASNESMNPMIHRSQVRIVSKIGDRLERASRAG